MILLSGRSMDNETDKRKYRDKNSSRKRRNICHLLFRLLFTMLMWWRIQINDNLVTNIRAIESALNVFSYNCNLFVLIVIFNYHMN